MIEERIKNFIELCKHFQRIDGITKEFYEKTDKTVSEYYSGREKVFDFVAATLTRILEEENEEKNCENRYNYCDRVGVDLSGRQCCDPKRKE